MANSEQVVKLDPIKSANIEIPIVGVTPVIPHRWSEKSLNMMREKQFGNTARKPHEPKVPEEEAAGATYLLDDGRPGIPAAAFKAATVGATRLFKGVTLVTIKAALFVEGEGADQLVPLTYAKRVLREDTPRNSTGVADLRYRYMYEDWSATLIVTYIPQLIDAESVVNLVDAGGMGGVGDWRPSAPKSLTGTYGRYQVNLK